MKRFLFDEKILNVLIEHWFTNWNTFALWWKQFTHTHKRETLLVVCLSVPLCLTGCCNQEKVIANASGNEVVCLLVHNIIHYYCNSHLFSLAHIF